MIITCILIFRNERVYFRAGKSMTEHDGDQRPLIAEFDERDSISYEEFGGTQDYVNCVTCQGTGRISRFVLP